MTREEQIQAIKILRKLRNNENVSLYKDKNKALSMAIEVLEQELQTDNQVDCIIREQAIASFADVRDGVFRTNGSMIADYDIVKILKELPSIKIEQKQGHWIDMNYYEEWWGKEYKCSECDGRMIGKSKYCPYCGYKMEEVSK